jgi:hypothetical protein
MSKNSNVAAKKLVELTQSKKEEIARKASLDVINHFRRKPKSISRGKEQAKEELPYLSPEKASRLLDALADDEKQKPEPAIAQ